MSQPDVFTLLERIHALELKIARYSVIASLASAVAALIGQRVINFLL